MLAKVEQITRKNKAPFAKVTMLVDSRDAGSIPMGDVSVHISPVTGEML